MPRSASQNKIWDPAESMPLKEMHELQLQRLRACIARASKVPFYHELFRQRGLTPDSIKTLDDIRRYPFTNKADLRQHYPLGMMAVPRESLARIHGSSGTTGKPTFVGYTQEDLEIWAGLCARFLVAGGLCSHHIVHVAFGYGLFTGGFGLHYGIEKTGAAVVPVASGNTLRQIMLIEDLRPDALVCTPSYALTIADAAHKEGIDPREFSLKYAYLGGEPWTEDMRTAIEREFEISAFNNYGLSEIIGPGVSGECRERQGMHIQEDHFLVECIDPGTLEPVGEGELGELVFTTLSRQAMPMIRYRTRDLASLSREFCPCGRSGVRMSRIKGRSDDMLIIRGVNIFPSQIEEALLRVDGAAVHYMIEVDRPGALDEITIRVEVNDQDSGVGGGGTQALQELFGHSVYATTGVRARVLLAATGTLERSKGKANRVLDLRQRKGR
jgi:phenylacetate-CoA ligase